MGNQQEAQDKKKFLESFNSMYQKEKMIQDSRFGEITIYGQNPQRVHKLFIKVIITQNFDEYDALSNSSSIRSKIHHKSILRLLGFDTIKWGQQIFFQTKFNFFCEYYDRTLQEEIEERSILKKYFPEKDVWFLIYQIIEAQLELIKNKLLIGDIRPFNIMLTLKGEVKIIDSSMLPSSQSSYQRFLTDKRVIVILSPEELVNIQNNNKTPGYNKEKSDVFCMGIMLLQVCSLALTGCYHDYSKVSLNDEAIEHDLDFISKIYSNFLIKFIRQCVQYEVNNRPVFCQLQSVLKPYKVKIQQLEQFNPNYNLSKESLFLSPDRNKTNQFSKAYYGVIHDPSKIKSQLTKGFQQDSLNQAENKSNNDIEKVNSTTIETQQIRQNNFSQFQPKVTLIHNINPSYSPVQNRFLANIRSMTPTYQNKNNQNNRNFAPSYYTPLIKRSQSPNDYSMYNYITDQMRPNKQPIILSKQKTDKSEQSPKYIRSQTPTLTNKLQRSPYNDLESTPRSYIQNTHNTEESQSPIKRIDKILTMKYPSIDMQLLEIQSQDIDSRVRQALQLSQQTLSSQNYKR